MKKQQKTKKDLILCALQCKEDKDMSGYDFYLNLYFKLK